MVLRDNLSFLRKFGAEAFPVSEEHMLATSLAEILSMKKAPCNLERILPSAIPLMSLFLIVDRINPEGGRGGVYLGAG